MVSPPRTSRVRRVAKKGKGYLLYSVGMNMRDDGGVLDRDKDKDDRAARADQ